MNRIRSLLAYSTGWLICSLSVVVAVFAEPLPPELQKNVHQILDSIESLQENSAGLEALSRWLASHTESINQEFQDLEEQIKSLRLRLEQMKRLRNEIARRFKAEDPISKQEPVPPMPSVLTNNPDALLSTQQIAFFEKKVRPLLAAQCYSCHSIDKNITKGGLNLDNAAGWRNGGDSGPAIVPGDVDDSLLIQAVRYDGHELKMPPKGKLKKEEIRILEMWVEMGAPDPRTGKVIARQEIDIAAGRQFWSFQPIRKPSLPEVRNQTWPTSGIDRFILAEIESLDLTVAEDADKESLIRRAYFDLIGLPPLPQEIDAFLQDRSPDAFEKQMDRLLNSPHFGERWGRHWLDVARYADSSGGGRAILFPNAWRYRDYVIRSFNQDKPFDLFITEQIAGDLMPYDSVQQRRDQLTATGYLTLGPIIYELQDKDQLDLDIIDEQIDTIGRSLLGMTVGCARCHDHKFDPVPTKDYYALAAIFKNTKPVIHANVSQFVERELPAFPEQEPVYEKIALFEERKNQIVRQIKQIQSNAGESLDSLPGYVVDNEDAVLRGEWVKSNHTRPNVRNGYLHDNNQGKGEKTVTFIPKNLEGGEYEVWLAYTPGNNRANRVPLTVHHAGGETPVEVDQSKSTPVLKALISLGNYSFEFRGGSVTLSNEGTTGHVIADAVVFVPAGTSIVPESKPDKVDITVLEEKIKALETGIKQFSESVPYPRPRVMAVEEKETQKQGNVHIRGSVHNKGEAVERGFLQVASFPSDITMPDDQSGRLQLAQWIANPQNPLTARVTVNRVWRHLFGEGIVRTTDNFGKTGELPSHPELLDYLAIRLIELDWRLKPLIKEIMMSHVYRISSTYNPEAAKVDPENRLLWRMNRKRLDAEALRDSMLYISGRLDLSMGGSSLKPDTKSEFGYPYEESRRSVYMPVFRNALYEMFTLFDMADPNLVNGNRTTSTLPTQALFMMNSPFVYQQSQATAERFLNRAEMNRNELIHLIYRMMTGRYPSEEEMKLTQDYLQSVLEQVSEEEAWRRVVQALFGSIDFRYVN